MKYLLFTLIFSGLIINTILAQENEEVKVKNSLSASFGYTSIREGGELGAQEAEGVLVPTIGLEYFYHLGEKWEIGLVTDLELSDYLIVEQDLHRENAFIVTAMASYEVGKNLKLLAGGGMEFEKNEHLRVFRLAADYQIMFKKEWFLAPVFIYDIKPGYDTFSLAIGFGKEF